ncbi:MAG TPA: PfkB family carbohydrate kinase [Thermoclostridium caenicola]|uniref:PfkB family carbohydrate kinase n=1 Tax=Thermoclostridium caenicola TaxID=659425 RepID=UPI00122D0BE8|nr:PfkB family carbohydrate kinase [Thermoclostridium caenicola]HOK43316.1 PfkB family carbohydrate kinase [Thermoclostridium caenicola]HOL84748.1 PfkB family carbohydrate kinase [Thermoclostridium caenicola]HOP72316.1 PfkB family carbohydrate kinase [Thermoclostridium caenicola]HPO77046.1 PfkB family carbohydrate kinase [Thermoclostridium caenicola]
MLDLAAIGELLIDFTPSGVSEQGNPLFECNPGGAPANVLAAMTRLGGTGAFIGKVGSDTFGSFLYDILKQNGIDHRGLRFDPKVHTTLAFVHLSRTGDRSFSFYRDPGADRMLTFEEVDQDVIRQAKAFHFGSVSMTHEPSRTATLGAARFARELGKTISYDPNLRPALWNSLEEAREVIIRGMEYADILKISEEELIFLTGQTDLEKGAELLAEVFRGRILLLTLGPNGCFFGMDGKYDRLPTYDKVKTIDTTGAGDAFLGGFLFRIRPYFGRLQELTFDELRDAVNFANAVGSLATTRKGAIPAMPRLEEVMALLEA